MAFTSQIQKNAEKLKENGAPDEIVQQYIKKATEEQSGGEKILSGVSSVVTAPLKAFAAPFAIASEGVRGLTNTKKTKVENALQKFAFNDAKYGTKKIAGKAVERALDIGAFAVPGGESTKSLSSAIKTGAKIGSSFGAGYGFAGGLQDENLTISSVLSDVLLGTVAGGTIGGALSGGIFGVGVLGSKTKSGISKTQKKISSIWDEATVLKDKAKKYNNFINDKSKLAQAMDDIADLAMDINPTLGEELRTSPGVRTQVKKQLEKGVKPSIQQEKLYEEMVSAIQNLDKGIKSKYSSVEDELISKFGKESPGSIQDTFIAAVKQWDDGVKISGKTLSFSKNAALSQNDKNFLQKLFTEEIANRGNTIQDFLTASRIMSEGIPFDKTTTKATKNIPKMAYGMLRGKIDDTLKYYGETGRISQKDASKWFAMNNEYKEFALFKENLSGIIDNINKPANVRKLDSILTQLGRTFRTDKPARQKFIKEISKKTGKNFYDALIANEIVRDLGKRKGIAGGKNILVALNRIFDVGKYGVLAETLEPSSITKNVVNPIKSGVIGRAGSGIVRGGQRAGSNISNTVNLLLSIASDETVDRGLRAAIILTVKEMLFPSK